MNAFQSSSDAGYSPEISAELFLYDHCFQVASLGPNRVVIRHARSLPPGRGTIRMLIDGHLTLYHVEFPSGISPEHLDQPMVVLSATEEVAA
jgi:hypothetical protein